LDIDETRISICGSNKEVSRKKTHDLQEAKYGPIQRPMFGCCCNLLQELESYQHCLGSRDVKLEQLKESRDVKRNRKGREETKPVRMRR
jgi:hypothetical protein